ncbi:MAG TPA: nucleotidyltransferase family protein, partial [Clostridia bacterium]
MEAVAVIAEFNPFHNGHALLFNRIDQIVGPEGAKAVFMSGCFTQRGEPALLDKWTRTRTALLCGADLVVELPFAYAAASAGRFAAGGVALACATGVCRHIAFGSETADLDTLGATAEILADEPDGFRARLREHLDLGKPFAGARIAALEDYMRDTSGSPAAGTVSPDAACLRTSNNILAVEYLMAIRRQKAGLQPHVILREGADYRNSAVDSMLPSATSIRAATRRYAKDPATLAGILRSGMPVPSLALLLADMLSGDGPVFPDDLSALVIG